MTIILFIIVLAILVFAHELGHFLSAKLFKIRVDEFAIGFPPKIWSFTYGETKYSINLIPFGGYVKIFGENPDDESISGPDSSRSFVNVSKWKQVTVLLSGIFFNIVLAWVFVSVAFNIGLFISVPDSFKNIATNTNVVAISVVADSPADKASLKPGDLIVGLKEWKKEITNPTVEQVQQFISGSIGEISLVYTRNKATSTVQILPKEGIISNQKAIGIGMDYIGMLRFGFFRSFYEGAKLTGIETKNIAIGIGNFIWSAVRGEKGTLSQVTGPVGIAGMIGKAGDLGISYLLGFVAVISINLALLNLIPFPALDGGRVLFVLIEAIIRRKIKPVIMNVTNSIGFFLLIGLMIFVTLKDVWKLIR